MSIENPQLRVLFITRKWKPATGGMEKYCIELTERLELRSELTLFSLAGRPNGMPPSFLSLLFFGFRAAAMIIRFGRQFEVLHIADMALWPLASLARFRNKKLRTVVSAHGTDIAYPLRSGLLPSLFRVYLHAGSVVAKHLQIIANSNATASLCHAQGFRVVKVVPLGVNVDEKSNELTSPEPYVLYVGRLVKRKGCAWFIRYVLPRLSTNIHLKVVGVEWDSTESAALNAERVEFLGPVYGENLSALRRKALAVIVPNISCGGRDFEGFGLTALEASSAGTVLLAARIDGIVDAVIDGRTGYLLPAEDPEEWANTIHAIADWPNARRQAFIDGCLATVRDNFSWERVASQTLAVYEN